MKYPKVKKKKRAGGAEPRRLALARARRPRVFALLIGESHRWVIPKGWPMKGRRRYATAAVEALQETGLLGKIEKTKLGSYPYQKHLRNGAALLCSVDVFPCGSCANAKVGRKRISG